MLLEELQSVTSHPKAVDLYEMVKLRLPKVSLGTVYRNLELLTEMGLVRKLDMGATEARFDGNVSPHDHVRCSMCDRLDDVFDHPIHASIDGTRELSGYLVHGYRLEFVGVCPSCAN